MRGDPIDGQVLVLASAKAGVGTRLPDLVDRAQEHLAPRIDEYRRRYETVHESADRLLVLAEEGHWNALGSDLGFDDRETDAVRRAHRQQLLRTGREEGRREEFESALEIREAVVIGTDGGQ